MSPTQTIEPIAITSDEDAMALLQDLMSHRIDADSIALEFDEWPRIKMVLTGGKFDGTITPRVMAGFIDLQKSIHQSYALVRYQDSSRRLSEEEKEQLEIVVSVEKGSSDMTALLSAPLQSAASGFVNMDSQHKLIAIVAIGLIWAGVHAFKSFLEYRRTTRIKELENQSAAIQKEVRIQELQQMQFMSEQETRRVEILTAASQKVPEIAAVEQISYDAKAALIKAASRADRAELQGVTLRGGELEELQTNARRAREEEVITGAFKVRAVDASNSEFYRVSLERVSDGLPVKVNIPTDINSGALRGHVKDAEWSHRPINFSLSVTKAGETITSATVLRASASQPEEE